VQYRTFDFEVMKTEHFDIYFYPEEKAGVEIAARMAERWYSRLRRLLRHELRGRQPLILYASHVDFEQTNVIGGEIGEGTGGVTEPIARRIVLPLAGPLAETDHVIGHELVHAFQFDMTSLTEAPSGMTGLDRLPLWFVEGMAESSRSARTIPTPQCGCATRRAGAAARIGDLADPGIPYRWGRRSGPTSFGRFGDQVIPQLLRLGAPCSTTRRSNSPRREPRSVVEGLARRDSKSAVPVLATGRELVDRRPIVQGREFRPIQRVRRSADGRWLAFLSSQSLIDVFIADATNGQIVRKLTSTATNAHFPASVHLLGGRVDRASRRLAIATVARQRRSRSTTPGPGISIARSGSPRSTRSAPAWAPATPRSRSAA
jgi:hypothetical protein